MISSFLILALIATVLSLDFSVSGTDTIITSSPQAISLTIDVACSDITSVSIDLLDSFFVITKIKTTPADPNTCTYDLMTSMPSVWKFDDDLGKYKFFVPNFYPSHTFKITVGILNSSSSKDIVLMTDLDIWTSTEVSFDGSILDSDLILGIDSTHTAGVTLKNFLGEEIEIMRFVPTTIIPFPDDLSKLEEFVTEFTNFVELNVTFDEDALTNEENYGIKYDSLLWCPDGTDTTSTCGTDMPAGISPESLVTPTVESITISKGGVSLPIKINGPEVGATGTFKLVDLRNGNESTFIKENLKADFVTVEVTAPTSTVFSYDTDGFSMLWNNIAWGPSVEGDTMLCSKIFNTTSELGTIKCSVTATGIHMITDNASGFSLPADTVLTLKEDLSILYVETMQSQTVYGAPVEFTGDFTFDFTDLPATTVSVLSTVDNSLPVQPCGFATFTVELGGNVGSCTPSYSWDIDGSVFTSKDLTVSMASYKSSPNIDITATVKNCFGVRSSSTIDMFVSDPPTPTFSIPASALVQLDQTIVINPGISYGCYWADRVSSITSEWTYPAALNDYVKFDSSDDTIMKFTPTTGDIAQGDYTFTLTISSTEFTSVVQSTTVTVDGDVSLSLLPEWYNAVKTGYVGSGQDLTIKLIANDETAIEISQAAWTLTSGSTTVATKTGKTALFTALTAGSYSVSVSVDKITGATLTISTSFEVLEAPSLGTNSLGATTATQAETIPISLTGATDALDNSIDLMLWGEDANQNVVVSSRVLTGTSQTILVSQTGVFTIYVGACDDFGKCVEASLGDVTISVVPPPTTDTVMDDVSPEEQLAFVASLASGEDNDGWDAIDEEARTTMAEELTTAVLDTTTTPELSDVLLVIDMGLELELNDDAYETIADGIEDVLDAAEANDIITGDQADSISAITDSIKDESKSRSVNLKLARQLVLSLLTADEFEGSAVSGNAPMGRASSDLTVSNNQFDTKASTGTSITSGSVSIEISDCSIGAGLLGCSTAAKGLATEKEATGSIPRARAGEAQRVTNRASVFIGVAGLSTATLDNPYTLSLDVLPGTSASSGVSCLEYDYSSETWISGSCGEAELTGTTVTCKCHSFGTFAGWTTVAVTDPDTDSPLLSDQVKLVLAIVGGLFFLVILGVCCCAGPKKTKKSRAKSVSMSSSRNKA
eukprot:gnl/Dysnectes_brevis/323_a357_4188.p1 GENE.gnl/Dysnectes_brevis/323_a357_4188~~gnl/Dysnectes_brevis/323_a357_4188.p1  ORF type:complete len:1173 (+),score=565.04 gnl/Dysnectes_brevis/323_a357_4188:772-4290(+)